MFVDFVAAGPWQRNFPERQASGIGLRLQQCEPRAVHGDALEVCVDRGEQADDFYVVSLTKNMEGPGTVFATAPREKDLFQRV